MEAMTEADLADYLSAARRALVQYFLYNHKDTAPHVPPSAGLELQMTALSTTLTRLLEVLSQPEVSNG